MELKAVSGRVVVWIDMQKKNSHRFEDGTTIRLERGYDNFNNRETMPVNATVIHSEHIPAGAEILIGHNALHEVNQILNYKPTSGKEIAGDIKYYSLPESECFLWRNGNEDWQPIPPFETALRVFKPYSGSLVGLPPEKLIDVLYATSGKLKGQVVKTVRGSDYEIVFQGENGREERKIRFRAFGDEKSKREEEAICILHNETKMVNDGLLLIGLSISDAKPLKELVHG